MLQHLLCPCLALAVLCQGIEEPSQIHIALTGNADEMNVAWVTMQSEEPYVVKYGVSKSALDQTSDQSTPNAWLYGGVKRVGHNVTLRGLKPATEYFYKVQNAPTTYSFRTLRSDGIGLRICIFGDLGLRGVNFQGEGQSIESLLAAARADKFDLVIHVGDIAYDLHSFNGKTGDDYLKKMEPLAATVPYMVIAGNHEDDDANFTNYKNRFRMPLTGASDSLYYSFNVGPIHFVGINTENYGYYYKYGMETIHEQYAWLVQDLEAVDRSQTPWIISYQHRPFYCSNENSGDCSAFENQILRTGFVNLPGLEPLFIKYKVDLGFWGHEHSYERFFPIANKVYYNDNDPYADPDAPVYIITGSAGCHSGYAYFTDPALPFSAKRVNDYGYSIMTIKDRDTLTINQISIEKNDAVVDSVVITKKAAIKRTNKAPSRRRGKVLPRNTKSLGKCHPRNNACLLQLQRMNREL